MCDFFSFVMVNGTPKYLDSKWRRKFPNGDPDSHSVICKILKLNCDKVNKFEYRDRHLEEDQINNWDDPIRHAESWIKKFIETKEWKDICQITVHNNPGQIAYMHPKDMSKNMQYVAVRDNAFNIAWIDNPSERLQLLAVHKEPNAIEAIINPTLKVQLYAVNNGNYDTIKHIRKPCERIQLAALRKNLNAYEYIDKPTKRVQKYYDTTSCKDGIEPKWIR